MYVSNKYPLYTSESKSNAWTLGALIAICFLIIALSIALSLILTSLLFAFDVLLI